MEGEELKRNSEEGGEERNRDDESGKGRAGGGRQR